MLRAMTMCAGSTSRDTTLVQGKIGPKGPRPTVSSSNLGDFIIVAAGVWHDQRQVMMVVLVVMMTTTKAQIVQLSETVRAWFIRGLKGLRASRGAACARQHCLDAFKGLAGSKFEVRIAGQSFGLQDFRV